MPVDVSTDQDLIDELRQRVNELEEGQPPALKARLQSLLNYVASEPDVVHHIICTGTMQEILEPAGVPSYNGPIRSFFKIYKDIYALANEEDVRAAVVSSAFLTKRSEELSTAQFTLKKFRSTTMRIHSSERLQAQYNADVAFREAYDRYELNASIRKEILAVMEAAGYFINTIDNLYGLIIRTSKDSAKMKVPDFIRMGDDGISAIYIVDRQNTDESACSRLYDGYTFPFNEYYVWTGYELERFLKMLRTKDPALNWKACDGSYRGIGNMVWDLLNEPRFINYYQTHSSADVAKEFGINTHQLYYISHKYPELNHEQQDVSVGNVTPQMLSLVNGSDRDSFFLISQDDPRYSKAIDFLSLNDENWERFSAIFEQIGYMRNRCYDGSIIACGNSNAPFEDIFIPDVVHFDFEKRSRRFGGLLLGNLSRDTSPEFFDFMKDLNSKFKRGKIGVVWEQEIESQYAKYGVDWSSYKAFGRIGYKGEKTLGALDLQDAALYRLSHTDAELIDHYGLENTTPEESRIFFNNNHLGRKELLKKRLFPSMFQTIEREQLSLEEDTIYNLGSFHGGRKKQQLWRTASNDEVEMLFQRQTSWCSYECNESARNNILKEFEGVLRLVENRLDSPYGLIYIEDKSGEVVIPDFVSLAAPYQLAFLIDDVDKNKFEKMQCFDAFEASRNAYSGIDTWLGFTVSLEEKLRELLKTGIVSQQNWHRRLTRFRIKYILSGMHFVELKKQREAEARAASHERLANRQQAKDEAMAKVESVEAQDKAVVKFEALASTRYVKNDQGDIVGYCYEDPSLNEVLGKCGYTGLFKAGMLPNTPYCQESYENFLAKEITAWELVPFMEQLGYIKNSADNDCGLVFSFNPNNQSCFIPDFVGIDADGKFCYVMLCDYENETEFSFTKLASFHQQAIRSQRRRGLVLWSGYHTTCFKRAIVSGEYNHALLKVQYLGKGNAVWDMLNDPDFKEYYWCHSAVETCQHYGVNKSQLEHVIYVHQEFRRPNDIQRFKSLLATNEKREDDYNSCDSHMVSKEELSLRPYLEKLGIYHNESQNFNGKPVAFGGLGVKSMLPDYLSADRKVVVEFDGEYYHVDPKEAEFRRAYYEHIGKTCCIIWESEYEEFIADPPETIEELIERYPCTWRNYRADEYYVLHHDYDTYLEQLLDKIAIERS